MSKSQQIRILVQQLMLDPTALEKIDINIETGLELMAAILEEFPDPSKYAHVFDHVECLVVAKGKYFNRTREVC